MSEQDLFQAMDGLQLDVEDIKALIGLAALASAALFTGGMPHASLVDHPARLALGNGPSLTQWQATRRRMRLWWLPVAIGVLCGLEKYGERGRIGFLIGSLLLLSILPDHRAAIGPTAKALAAIGAAEAPHAGCRLLRRWARGQIGLIVLGFAAMGAFIVAL